MYPDHQVCRERPSPIRFETRRRSRVGGSLGPQSVSQTFVATVSSGMNFGNYHSSRLHPCPDSSRTWVLATYVQVQALLAKPICFIHTFLISRGSVAHTPEHASVGLTWVGVAGCPGWRPTCQLVRVVQPSASHTAPHGGTNAKLIIQRSRPLSQPRASTADTAYRRQSKALSGWIAAAHPVFPN